MRAYAAWFRAICIMVILLFLPPVVHPQEQKESPGFTREELDQMLAPVALYPDQLLAQVLMASTYPLEVVQAARWVKENPKLQGNEAEAALKKKNWDPAVKSLVPFPQVLEMMNDNLEWTQKMGDTFLAQEKDVSESIQRLRAKAEKAGNLKTTEEQKVIVEKTETTQIIKVEPTTQLVYVPTYNPTVVYGAWAYPAYPPVAMYPPGYVAGTAIMSFGIGVAVGSAMYGGWNWHHGDVEVDRNYNANRTVNRSTTVNRPTGQANRATWQHNPQHRQNVPYRNQNVARQYNQTPAARAQAQQNLASRGYGAGGARNVSYSQGAGQPGAFSGANNGASERVASARGQNSRSGAQTGAVSRPGATSGRTGGTGAGVSRGAGSFGGGGGGGGGGARGGGGRRR